MVGRKGLMVVREGERKNGQNKDGERGGGRDGMEEWKEKERKGRKKGQI